METIVNIFTGEIANIVGWTIVHSIWQGILIGILVTILFQLTGRNNALWRYRISISALFIFVVAIVFTYFKMIPENTQTHQELSTETIFIILNGFKNPETSSIVTYLERLQRALPVIVGGWLLGVLFLSVRLGGGYWHIKRLKKRATNISSNIWNQRLSSIIHKLNIKRKPGFKEISGIDAPMVVGYLKPVILIPVGILSTIPVVQLEAILAHELAHIKRNDYLINIIQSVIEVLFFYHPLVWWLSSVISTEREHLCDDMAINVCGETLTFAKALTTMETIKNNKQELAMAFTGKKQRLFKRVKRILTPQNMNNSKSSRFIFSSVFILIFVLFQVFGNFDVFASKTAQETNEKVKKEIKEFSFEMSDSDIKYQNRDKTEIDISFETLKVDYNDSTGLDITLDGELLESNEITEIENKIRNSEKITFNKFNYLNDIWREIARIKSPETSEVQDTVIKKKRKTTTVIIEDENERRELEFEDLTDDIKKSIEKTLENIKEFDHEDWTIKMEQFDESVKKHLEYINSEEYKEQMKLKQKELEEFYKNFDSEEYKEKMKEFEFKLQKKLKHLESKEFKKQLKKHEEYINSEEFKEKAKKIEEQYILMFDSLNIDEHMEKWNAYIEEHQEEWAEKMEEVEEIIKKQHLEFERKHVEEFEKQEQLMKEQEEQLKEQHMMLEEKLIELESQAVELEKLDDFLQDIKKLLIKKDILSKDDKEFELHINKNEVKVNGKKLDKKLSEKILKLQKEHLGEEGKHTLKVTSEI